MVIGEHAIRSGESITTKQKLQSGGNGSVNGNGARGTEKGFGLSSFMRPGSTSALFSGIPAIKDLPGESVSPDTGHTASLQAPEKQKYPEYKKHPAEVIFMGTVVLPRFATVTEKTMYGKSDGEKQEYLAGLVDAYRIVEANPTNWVEQMQAIQKAGLSNNYDYLGQVREMMPRFQDEREKIFAEAEGRSYRQNKSIARRAQRSVRHQIGKDELALLPEKPGLPLEMVTNLATLDSMIRIFTKDAYDRYPELKNEKGRKKKELNPVNRARTKEKIAEHVTGLLTAYVVSESHDVAILPDGSSDYKDRFKNLQSEIAAKKTEIEQASSEWTPAQQRRHVLRAKRHLEPFSDTFPVTQKQGLNDEMITDAKKARVQEYVKSSAWMGAIEGGQLGIGWAIGGGTADLFELKNLAAVATIALVGRAVTSALLYKKQQLSGEFYEKKGYAPDPATKWFGDRLDKPKLGFALSHWPVEGVYAGATVAAMHVLGTVPGLATEIA